mgnify:CR=1 FL=1
MSKVIDIEDRLKLEQKKRRQVEKALVDGSLLGVVSTNGPITVLTLALPPCTVAS